MHFDDGGWDPTPRTAGGWPPEAAPGMEMGPALASPEGTSPAHALTLRPSENDSGFPTSGTRRQ